MEEDQERQHRERLDESTEMMPFCGLGNTAGQAAQLTDEGEETQRGHEEKQQEISPLSATTNTREDSEGEK